MKAVTRGAWIRFVQAALIAAALVAIPGLGFAQDTDGDGMSNNYENFFFLNPTNAADALLDYDGDTLTNRYEAQKWTDPWTEDTDMDGWWDNWDSDPLSRAVFYWGAAELTTGNVYRYTGPKWCLWGSKVGTGLWSNGWFVAMNNTATNNCLRMDFNRAYLTNDLSMDLYLYDHAGAALYADLLSSNGISISNNILGNLVKGTNQTRIVRVTIPLKANPAVRTLQLRRTAGEVRVYGTLLFVDRDGDRLDDAQEAYIGSSPTNNALPFMIPGKVEFENFNTGGEGVSYHDTTSNNEGGQYRTTEGVDIEACSDTNGGYNVGYTKAGEWMDYTVNVLTAGWYNVIFRVANGEAAGASFHLEADGANVTGPVALPATGGWQVWQDVTVTNVWLYRGAQILTLVLDSQGAGANVGNYNHIRLVLSRAYVNNPPRVTVSGDTSVVLPATARLNATLSDDGIPTNTLYGGWRQVIGPATATFTNTQTLNTSASFPVAGTYVLRLLASDTEFSGWGDITVNVTVSQPPILLWMNINSGAASTPSRSVTLANLCNGGPTQYIASESAAFSGAAWQTYSTGPSFTLSSNAGNKTVYFKVRNHIAESPFMMDSIQYSPPVTLTVNAAPVTNSISAPQEEDWYTFTAAVTGAYTVTARKGTLFDACYVVVFGPNSYTATIIPTLTQAVFTATSTGTYYVRISAWQGAAIGTYSINVVQGQPPWVESMYIDLMAASTPSRTVTLTNWCGGNPTQYMASESSNFTGAAWQTYSTGPSFTLSSNAGTKTVHFKVRNAYLESPAKSDSIVYSPPVPLTVNAAPVTNSISVLYEEDWYTFNASATGAYTVVAQRGTLTAGCFVVIYEPGSYRRAIIGVQTQATFTASVTGTYYVSVSVLNGTATGSYSIRVIKGQPPWVSSVYIDSLGYASTPSRNVTLTNWCGGDPTQYMASEASNFSGAAWQTYSTGPAFTLSSNAGKKTVYFKVKNDYWESPAKNWSIQYSPPVTLAVNGAPITNSISVLYEEDWYTFNAGVTGAYTVIAPQGTLTAACYVVIYGPNSYRQSIIGTLTQAAFTATSAGTYYARVSVLNGTATGSYTIRLTGPSQPVVTNALVGKWSFEQAAWTGAVNEVVDSSGLGNHGRAYNGAAPTSGGVSGKAAWFGTTNAYVEIPNSSNLQVAGSMTLSFWIKANNIGNNRLNPIDKNYGGEFALTIETDGRLSYYHGTAQSTSNYWSWTALPAGKLVNSIWQNVIIVRDAVSNRVSSYYNGALVSQTTYSTATNLKPKASTSPVRIGRGYTAATVNGRLDEVQIHSRALSAAEVQALFLTNRPPNQPPYVNAQPDQVVKWPATVTLNGKSVDDGLPSNVLKTTWSKVSGTGTVTFANATSLVTTASFSTSGVYVVRLTGSDGVLSSNDDVRVVANQPPSVFAGSNQTIRLPASMGLNGTMWDDKVPSNKVTVAWDRVSGPGPVVFSVTNNLITLANFSSSGVYVLRLRANDTLMTSTSTVSITVNAATGTIAYQESGGYFGLTAFEAEAYETNIPMGGSSWVLATSPTGFSGTGMMTSAPNSGVARDTGYVTNSPRMDYRVNFRRTGTHYVWIRGRGPSGNDDSCHVGLDGAAVSTADRINGFTTNWGWSRVTSDGPAATLNVTNVGIHTVNVWMREDGILIDKIALATNAAYTPTGSGPPVSQRAVSWIDGDGDGLSDWEETNVYGTNPLNRDSDGDGALDGYDPRPTTANVAPVMGSISMTSTGNFHTASAVALSATATDADGDGLQYQFIVDSTVVRSWSSTATASWTPSTNSFGYHVTKVAARDPLNATNQISRSLYIFRAPPTP